MAGRPWHVESVRQEAYAAPASAPPYHRLMSFWRAVIVWAAILVAAIANGALRQGVLIPRLGDGPAHVVSTLLLSAVVFVVTWLTIGWMGPGSAAEAWRLGLFWVALTVAFEFLAGHYVFGTPWARLVADYDVLAGRVWVLVLISTLIAPIIAARAKGLIS